jgi:hypothetical protein
MGFPGISWGASRRMPVRYAAAPKMFGKTTAAGLIKLRLSPKSVISPVSSKVLGEVSKEALTLFAR